MKDKEQEDTSKEEMLNCKECKYKCKKEITLKKHMVTHHENHKCKEYREKLNTSTELLKHIAKHHSKEGGDITEKENVKETIEQNEKDKDFKEEDKDNNDKKCVF